MYRVVERHLPGRDAVPMSSRQGTNDIARQCTRSRFAVPNTRVAHEMRSSGGAQVLVARHLHGRVLVVMNAPRTAHGIMWQHPCTRVAVPMHSPDSVRRTSRRAYDIVSVHTSGRSTAPTHSCSTTHELVEHHVRATRPDRQCRLTVPMVSFDRPMVPSDSVSASL
jgi:hypothetical protein